MCPPSFLLLIFLLITAVFAVVLSCFWAPGNLEVLVTCIKGHHNPIPALRAWRNLSYQRTGAGSQTLHCWHTSVSPHFRRAFFPQWHRLFVGVLCMGLMGVWCSVSKMDLTVNTDVYCTAELPKHEGKEWINCHCCWNSLTTCPSSTDTAAHVTYLVVPLAQITLSLILFLLNFLEHLSIPEHMD